jgi:D-glycero-alpha-D-manno-heptose-7-phosphate kinase
MIITRSPFRLSFFGGSSDYKEFYEKHGSFLIGTTIDKYNFISIRARPDIMPRRTIVTYSKMEEVTNFDQISNPLIRETLKYFNPHVPIEFNSFADVPGRTGLGGSSAYCVGLCYALRKLLKKPIDKRTLVLDAIKIEREILKESGGIQDQIWAAYGGLNSIEINTKGEFAVKPLPVTSDFELELESSIVMLYTGGQRFSDEVAKAHENKNKTKILALSKEAYQAFLKEDIKKIGRLIYETWKEKKTLSPLISTPEIEELIRQIMDLGAYGAKLIGSGGCGFIMVICDPLVKKSLITQFPHMIMDIKFEKHGVMEIYRQTTS